VISTPPDVADAADMSESQKAGKTAAARPRRPPNPEDIPVDPTLSGDAGPQPLPQPLPPAQSRAPNEPRRAPTQRFFPTVSGGTGRDPAGNNR